MVESTKVFVHGNPETSAIWSLLVNELHKNGVNNIVLLTPPGFGAPTPNGWGATVIEYRDWLLGELDKINTPIDLVGAAQVVSSQTVNYSARLSAVITRWFQRETIVLQQCC